MIRGAIVAVALLAAAAAPARAQAPPILPPFPPAAFPPGAPADCPDGNPSCIDQVLAEMYRRINAVVPVCDHRAVFALTYIRTTEGLRRAAAAGAFEDRAWLTRLDVLFANQYFGAYDHWAAGQPDAVPAAWRIGFAAAQGRQIRGLGNLLAELNAHISRDLAFAVAAAGLTRADGTSHRADFDKVNDTLAQLMDPVLREITQRFDPTADDLAVGPAPQAVPGLIRKWRDRAWANAERLVAAQSPQEQADVAASIDQEAAAIGAEIVKSTQYRDAAKRVARDAWCAQHGGQRPAAYRPGAAALRLRHKTIVVRADGRALVRLSCPAPSLGCRGAVAILRGRRTLGRREYALSAGRVTTLQVAVRGAARHTAPVVVRLARAGVRSGPEVVTVRALLRPR